MSLIDQLAADIAASGVRRVFGITGSGASLSLLDGLERRGVAFHNCQFEGAAAIMAAITGRLTGHAGVALSIKGPGLANMVPGLAAAALEAWPLVAIAEAYAPSVGPAKAHKRMDQATLVGAVAKGRRQLGEGEAGFAAMAGWAEAEVPGPVLLELAGDNVPTQAPPPSLPEARPADAALALIAAARRPIVIVGSAAERLGWSGFTRLAVPVFTTVAAKGAIDERLPQAAGIFTGVGLDLTPECALLPHTDLIVGFGLRTNELLGLPFGAIPVVNVDPLGDAASPGIKVAASTSDASAVLDALAAAPGWGGDALSSSRERLRAAMLSHGFQPPEAFEVIQAEAPARARVVLDTGYFCTVGEHAWIADDPRRCLGSPQGRYMGIALPTGIGAALADSVPTVVVAGDGGIGMFLGEFRLAVELKLPLLLVLMSDGGYGSVRTRAIAEGLTQSPMLKREPSWRRVVEGFGCAGAAVTDAAALAAAVSAWNPAEGPAYIEIGFEPVAYQSMVQGVR